MDMTTIICKNDKCFRVVPPSKNKGVPRLFCEERCRNRYNARLNYQRQTKGASFLGLRNVTNDGYPKVNRKISPDAKVAERRVKEHGDNCTGPGKMCEAKLHDAYNTKKLCLIRAVFTDDWLELMYGEEGKVKEREMTTPDGMWKDDFKARLAKSNMTEEDVKTIAGIQEKKDREAFTAAGGDCAPSTLVIPD